LHGHHIAGIGHMGAEAQGVGLEVNSAHHGPRPIPIAKII
jgi:hypothetical protein